MNFNNFTWFLWNYIIVLTNIVQIFVHVYIYVNCTNVTYKSNISNTHFLKNEGDENFFISHIYVIAASRFSRRLRLNVDFHEAYPTIKIRDNHSWMTHVCSCSFVSPKISWWLQCRSVKGKISIVCNLQKGILALIMNRLDSTGFYSIQTILSFPNISLCKDPSN